LLGGIRRHPLIAYFTIVYSVSAASLVVLGLPRLSAGGTQNPASLAVFPVLILSVAATGIALTAATGGRRALGELWGRMRKWRDGARWYLVLAIPPAGVLITLFALKAFMSPAFAPGLQWFGLPIGLVAGFFEEIGWTGFAYPRMQTRFGACGGAVLLGVMWGVWHLPVVDSLGAASPHGAAWPAYFVSFVALVAAIRCLICWLYSRTGSVLLAQLMHASFTGTLILFSAPHVSAWQEAGWYAVYAGLMWLVVLVGAGVMAWRGARTDLRANFRESTSTSR
jgi:membrane protease YdiL (CAAX protease family)